MHLLLTQKCKRSFSNHDSQFIPRRSKSSSKRSRPVLFFPRWCIIKNNGIQPNRRNATLLGRSCDGSNLSERDTLNPSQPAAHANQLHRVPKVAVRQFFIFLVFSSSHLILSDLVSSCLVLFFSLRSSDRWSIEWPLRNGKRDYWRDGEYKVIKTRSLPRMSWRSNRTQMVPDN